MEHEAGEEGASSMKNMGYLKVGAVSASVGSERRWSEGADAGI